MKNYFAIQQADKAADIYIFGDIVPLNCSMETCLQMELKTK